MEAGPWISLGLKGANKIIDKHFDKVPNKYLSTDTYKPKALSKTKRNRERQNSQDQSPDSEPGEYEVEQADEEREVDLRPESDTEEGEALRNKDLHLVRGVDMAQPMPRDGSLPGGAYSQEGPYITPPFPQYSHEPPRQRPQYIPESAPPIGVAAAGYYSPPPQNYGNPYDRRSRDRRRDSWDEDDDYYSDSYRRPTRPKAVTRRSSSYHGPRGRDRDYDDDDDNYGALVAKRGKNPSGSEHIDKARHTAHRYGLKDEIEGNFTKSKAGLAGGAVGAVVAGWAANKAQIGYSKGRPKEPNALVTLLGAAVGGLAVNAIVDKYEDGKKDAKDKSEKWDDKYDRNGGDTRSEGGRSHRSNRRDDRDGYGSDGGRSNRSRRRKDSAYGSDGYD
ncbi:hypothetical protein BDZ45DRAFT_490866 [Acephala macrosclerotiorum]|nr:hypothetical protein BDZ45DRAFT_490866 [Acephala macrosclerotiorum]